MDGGWLMRTEFGFVSGAILGIIWTLYDSMVAAGAAGRLWRAACFMVSVVIFGG
jgi:hypothetical protein